MVPGLPPAVRVASIWLAAVATATYLWSLPEDVDLILDWRLIGYSIDEPWEERSNTKQDRFKLDTIERTNRDLAETFAPSLRASISEELGIDADVRPAEEEETGGIRVPADVRLLGDARRDKARDRAARVMDPVDDGGGDAVRR
ncbi:hypothetical protein [Olsenella profusa]|uniref:Uncharacterized protein n=1 Tax=Olsenella profusa F0195 TaxID=1125712 RepID=U2V2Q8_9ACTN|nr:hypothetical protein [Olsenella profusa]ERL09642.1 hypothetical protein HMPREF1316_2478 [Olsenella profusa F0195]